MNKELFANPLIFPAGGEPLDSHETLVRVACICNLMALLLRQDISIELSGESRGGMESLFIFLGETARQVSHLIDEEMDIFSIKRTHREVPK